MCRAWRGLNDKMQPISDKNVLISVDIGFDIQFSGSECICLAGSQMEKKRLSVFMKLEIFSNSITSK